MEEEAVVTVAVEEEEEAAAAEVAEEAWTASGMERASARVVIVSDVGHNNKNVFDVVFDERGCVHDE